MKIPIRPALLGLLLVPLAGGAASVKIPPEVLAGIEAKAAEVHPDSRSGQKRFVREQSVAFHSLREYENQQVPTNVISRIRINVATQHPYDFKRQLFFLNQQANLFLKFGLVTSQVLPPRVVDCEDLEWRLAVRGQPATYRGSIKPGSADIVYIEVRKGLELIGQNFAFPNPGGAWEVMVWGDHYIKRTHREKFHCEKY